MLHGEGAKENDLGVRSAAVLVLLAGCSRCGEAVPDRPLTIGTLYEPTTLDPAFADTTPDREMVELLYRGLTVVDDTGRLQPSLAERLPEATTATDGTEHVRWRLRAGYAWSDGRPITSTDVLFGHLIEVDDRLETSNHASAKNVARMSAEGPYAFTTVWKRPYIDHAEPRVHAILPAHAYPSPAPHGFAGMVRAEVSSGPYRLEAWVPGQYLAVVPNPGWGGSPPQIPRIVFRFFKSEDGLVAAFEAGEVDAAGEGSGLGLDAADLLAAHLEATHVVDMQPSGGWLHLAVRLDQPPLSDDRVRRAISMAIDRDALARVVYHGHAQPAFGVFPEGHPGHAGAGPLAFDPDGARRLIEAAGATGAKIELMYPSSPAAARASELIAEALKNVGIEVDTIGVNFRVLSDKLRAKTQAGLTLYVWRISPLWDGRSLLHSSGAQNASGLHDAELDRLLDDAEVSTDRAAWSRLVLQVNLRFQKVLPDIPLLFKEVPTVRPKGLDGWAPTGSRTPVTWNAERWRNTRSSP